MHCFSTFELEAAASKPAVFTMNQEPDLRDGFVAGAVASYRPASRIMRELMLEFVQRQREPREYDGYRRGEVEAGRVSMHSCQGRSNNEVEAWSVSRRAQVDHQA